MKLCIRCFQKQKLNGILKTTRLRYGLNIVERQRETRGEGEREVVLGLKEKISSTEGARSPSLDLPSTTRFALSGLRIHAPHVTGPCLDPPPTAISQIFEREREGRNFFLLFPKRERKFCFPVQRLRRNVYWKTQFRGRRKKISKKFL